MIFTDPTIRKDIPQITHSRTKLSVLYKKIYMKTGTDQGLGDDSLQATLMIDLLFSLQEPWMLQRMKKSEVGREEEEKSSGKIKTSKKIDVMMGRKEDFFL